MPHFSDTPTAPLNNTQVNQSRFVTKSRCVAEALNGKIKKKFQYFDKSIQNTTIPYMFEDLRIAYVLLYMTFKPPTTYKMDEMITPRMN